MTARTGDSVRTAGHVAWGASQQVVVPGLLVACVQVTEQTCVLPAWSLSSRESGTLGPALLPGSSATMPV